jgi:FkbM family methyltransferase
LASRFEEAVDERFRDVAEEFGLHEPFYARRGSQADHSALGQIFQGDCFAIERHHQGRVARAFYADLLSKNCDPLILDLGANIGAAARYFRRQYPESRLIAVEPEGQNAHLCDLNLRQVAAASASHSVVQAAVGSRQGSLFLADPGVGEWGYQVGTSGEREVAVVDVPSLLADLPETVRPFLCKIDIEGGEKDLFSANHFWVYDFAVVILELHDWLHPFERCTHYLQRVFASSEYDMIFSGENLTLFSYKHLLAYHHPYKSPLFAD